MKIQNQFLQMGFSLLTLLQSHLGAAEVWKVAALDYPPFSCDKSCSEFGGQGKAFKEAMASVGVDVQYTFMPWGRAIKAAKDGEYMGYFPAWPEDCQPEFQFSESMTSSPVGIMESKMKPLSFSKTEDLKKYTIGIVQDYGNTVEFNELVKKGTIKTVLAYEDNTHFKPIAAGRLDGALIDANVFKHLLVTKFSDLADTLQMNPTILEVKKLGICFLKTNYAKYNEPLKKALEKVKTDRIVRSYLGQHFKSLK